MNFMKKSFFTAENFKSARPDGRFDRSLGFIYESLRRKEPKLSFDRVSSAAEFPAWRERVREKLRELLRMVPHPQPEFVLLKEEKRDGYRLFHYEFYPEDLLAVPFLMLIPEDVIAGGRKVPAVICNPGSGAGMKSLAGEPDTRPNRYPGRNRQAWWYVKAGFIAVAIENPATAENSEPGIPYGLTQLRFLSLLMKAGRTCQGFITEQRLMVLEFLKKHPLVDPGKLACSGLSLGCGGILYTTVLSDDVRAMIYNDFVCDGDARLFSVTEFPADPVMAAGFIPGASDWFAIQPDLTASIAPRPMLLAEGGAWKGNIEKIVRSYEMLDARENLSLNYYKKYADPASRKYDSVDLRKTTGLTGEDYLDYSYVDVSQHSFHPELAIPWLTKLFFGKECGDPALSAEIEASLSEKEHFFNADDEEIFPDKEPQK
ncbi:MAG: Abhydrolase family protein [Lentisphaerae bacterium ADurb.Bin242]|nr:MAG: Abhydrolase family protein [Lentisphaerae bacterium ADurb.Bin242]